MCQLRARRHTASAVAIVLLACSAGCTSVGDYVRNGFKVGPNYRPPCAPVAQHWIDANDLRTEPNPGILRNWWTIFRDPTLDRLIFCAYKQNLTLREACCRVLQARAVRAIAVGEMFPQSQFMQGGYTRIATAVPPGTTGVNRFLDNWNYGFGLAWELDFWGRLRRAVAAADANLEASVAGYDDVLVTLLGDVASNYVIVRTTQMRIDLLRANAELQRRILKFIDDRFKAGFRQTELDLDQSLSNLRQTEAGIPQLEIIRRQAEDALCVLLGMPPVDMTNVLGAGPIPYCPPDAMLGIPCDLLRRRPDVRQAERLAAAQAEQIGIAEAALYPTFSIDGSFGYTANRFADLFRNTSFNGSFGPSFHWDLLNYGRIVSNVALEDARFQELAYTYQQTVLQAQREVEDGLVTFLRAQRGSRLLNESVDAAQKAVNIVILQYQKGAVDFNRYAVIQQNLVTQQDAAAQVQGQIAQGLIAVYRALGGGWEIRLCDGKGPESLPPAPPPAATTGPGVPPAPE